MTNSVCVSVISRTELVLLMPLMDFVSGITVPLSLLCFRYEAPQIALRCGIMLRECIRHEPLAKIVLFSSQFRDFFKYVELSTFDIASDAFATFKVKFPPKSERIFISTKLTFREALLLLRPKCCQPRMK